MGIKEDIELNKEKNKFILITSSADIIKTLFRCTALVLIFYFGFDSLKEFAGKFSTADLKLISSIEINKWVPVLIGMLIGAPAFCYGVFQKKLRKDYINRYTSRIKFLENSIDPNRSSSGLTSTGDNQPED